MLPRRARRAAGHDPVPHHRHRLDGRRPVRARRDARGRGTHPRVVRRSGLGEPRRRRARTAFPRRSSTCTRTRSPTSATRSTSASSTQLGPSIAIFEPGFLQVVLAYHEAGALPPGTLVKLYFAAGGYLTPGRPLWGVPPIPEALDLYLAMLGDSGIPWAVAVVGGDALDRARHTPRARARRTPARRDRGRPGRDRQRRARRGCGCAVRRGGPPGGDPRGGGRPARPRAGAHLGGDDPVLDRADAVDLDPHMSPALQVRRWGATVADAGGVPV